MIIWKSKTESCPVFVNKVIEELKINTDLESEIHIVLAEDVNLNYDKQFFVWSSNFNLSDYNQYKKNSNFLGVLGSKLQSQDLKSIFEKVQSLSIRNLRQTEVFQKVKSQNLKYENLSLKLTEQIEEQTKKLQASQTELEVKVKFLKHALQIVKSFVEVSSLQSFFNNFKKTFAEDGVKDVVLFIKEVDGYKIKSSDINVSLKSDLEQILSLDKKKWADITSRPVIDFKAYPLDDLRRLALGFEFTNFGAQRSQSFFEKFDFLKNIFVMLIEALMDEEEIKRDSILWSDSFKSFKEPILIIDEFYKIVRSNFGNLHDRKSCYKVLFDRDEPCEKCPITDFHKGQLQRKDKTINLNTKYDLNSFTFELTTEIRQRLWVHHYEDKESVNLLKGQFIKAEKLAYLGNLVDIVIHRISNPLTGMKMTTEMLLQEEHIEPFKEDFTEIYSGLNRCFLIIKNLKEFSESKIETTSVNLNALVQDTLILMKSITRNIQFRLDSELMQNVECSKGLAQQVLFNLIHNSCQAMDFKGRISITEGENKDGIFLDIIDSGPGIPSEMQGKIFSPFFSTKSNEDKGTGIGLFLSKLIMKQLGGDLILMPESPQPESGINGAYFRMLFPKNPSGKP